MAKVALPTLLFLAACGGGPGSAPNGGGIAFQPGHTDDQVESLKADFAADFGVTVRTTVVFVDQFSIPATAEMQIGMCYENQNYVEILYKYEGLDAVPVIVYHELGHCVLHVGHDENQTDIMSPSLIRIVTKNFESYVTQMKENYIKDLYPPSY